MKYIITLCLIVLSLSGYSQTTPSPVVVAPSEKPEVELNFEKFAKQRETAKIFQFVGAAAVATATYYQIKYTNENKNKPVAQQKEVSPYIALAGFGVMTVGFVIDMDASKHLRRKK